MEHHEATGLFAGKLATILSVGAAVGGNALAWLESINVGAITTAITAVAFAIIGAVVVAIQKIGPTWTDFVSYRAQKELEIEKRRLELEAEADSRRASFFSAQLTAAKSEIVAVRAEQQKMKEDYTGEVARAEAENVRLTHQLELATRQLDAAILAARHSDSASADPAPRPIPAA